MSSWSSQLNIEELLPYSYGYTEIDHYGYTDLNFYWKWRKELTSWTRCLNWNASRLIHRCTAFASHGSKSMLCRQHLVWVQKSKSRTSALQFSECSDCYQNFTYSDKVYTQSMYKTRICGDTGNLMSHCMLSFCRSPCSVNQYRDFTSSLKVVDALFEWLFKGKQMTLCRLECPNDDEQIDSISLAVQSEGQVNLATFCFLVFLLSLHMYTPEPY